MPPIRSTGIADNLGRALTNLGVLLSNARRVTDAAAAYRRAVELREALYAAYPDNVDIKAGYAGSLCAVGRFAKAARLIDEVLALVPEHPYANQLRHQPFLRPFHFVLRPFHFVLRPFHFVQKG
jgi:tetratricopeptide (TPR) repeat protein